ncbi:uncharacterized protein LOC121864488 isoform X2 [Homarus americanus]|nr:uncharacterized protein LOC121864488 isoform X2 [Homarus americanus]
MVKVKQWWDDEGWFGKQESKLRTLLRGGCSYTLELLSQQCVCPILILTLELMFSTKAGFSKIEKPHPHPYHIVDNLNGFLLNLQPFGIEKLYTGELQFDCPSLIGTICKLSPRLKWIHLKIEFAKGSVLQEIGHTAPNIETVIIAVRECELYETTSWTVEIVIMGGQGLEENLYAGFFDGLDKIAVNHKIQNGENLKLSFPKLKYIDVGSHRDVREFLHHLLYSYPDIKSITCDSENWVLSKYSIDFPVITPSTLGNGPISLQGRTVTYNLRDMSFSSFCLASKLHDIIARFRKLEHVSLHLLKGPWKIKSTSENAKELLTTISCQYLTICVDVYMSKEDLLSLYTPSLHTIGSSLKILQFHLTNEVNVGVLCQLINMCPCVEELSLVTSCERCEVEGEDDREIRLNELKHLKCLSVSSQYNVTNALYVLSCKLILSATNLTTLELDLGGKKDLVDWLLKIATSGDLARLKIFRLNFPECNLHKVVMTDFLLSLINAMPRLSCLMVGSVCYCVLNAVRARYRWSKLRIIWRSSSYVAFRNLSSRCC